VADREGRARHGDLGAERARGAAHESGLPGAELTREEDEVTVGELAGELCAERFGRLDAVGLEAASLP